MKLLLDSFLRWYRWRTSLQPWWDRPIYMIDGVRAPARPSGKLRDAPPTCPR